MEYTFSSADEARRQKLGKIIAQELAQKDKESMEYLIADARGRWLYMRLLERCHMFGTTCPDESKTNTAFVWEGERRIGLVLRENIMRLGRSGRKSAQTAEEEYWSYKDHIDKLYEEQAKEEERHERI